MDDGLTMKAMCERTLNDAGRYMSQGTTGTRAGEGTKAAGKTLPKPKIPAPRPTGAVVDGRGGSDGVAQNGAVKPGLSAGIPAPRAAGAGEDAGKAKPGKKAGKVKAPANGAKRDARESEGEDATAQRKTVDGGSGIKTIPSPKG